MTRSSVVLVAAAALALAACSGNSGSSGGNAANTSSSAAPAAAATNSTGFPLPDNTTVISAKDFSQNVDASAIKAGGAAFNQGSGTYAGHQVIAKSSDTMQQLGQWLDGAGAKPPEGFTAAKTGAGVDQARAKARQYGIDFEPFTKDDNGKKVGLIVVAMDPAVLDKKLGPAIALITKFRSLPELVRAPIDNQLKAKVGMSGSEMLDPGSPIGAALAAYDDVKGTNQRAIVLVDAAKQ